MTITGTLPSAIAAFLNVEKESLSGIEIKSNDVDVILTDKGKFTELYAVGMGNGTFEIIEIDDNLNLLPEYDAGDVISMDVLKKLFTTVINSSLILSFNPLGKVKYGVKDKVNQFKGKINKGLNKVKEAGKWMADIIEPQDAQKYVRENGYPKANVGKVGKTAGSPKDGGYYTVLFGNPPDRTFHIMDMYRNGKDFRALNDLVFEAEEVNDVSDLYEEKTTGKPVTREKEETPGEPEPAEENNVIENDDGDWKYTNDGIAYQIHESVKKKKKKSKNGCNVTGYEDGTLISPMSVGDGGMAVASEFYSGDVFLNSVK